MRYWPSVRSRWLDIGHVLFRVVSINKNAAKNVTRPIFSYLDRTSLVNKGFIIWPKEEFFLRDHCGKSRAGKIGPSCPLQWLCSAGEITHQVIWERSIEGPNVRDRMTCVLCSPLTLSGIPNECWLHTCHVCVIAPWRLGVWAPIFAHNDRSTCNFKSNWYSELLFLCRC